MTSIKYDKVCQLLKIRSSGEWPDAFEAGHISKMQYPDDISYSQLICKTIVADCKASHLKHTVSVEIRRRPAPTSADSSTASLMRAALIDTSYEATIYRITAPDLENWMLKQGETPSEHLSWWFQSASTVHDDTATPAPVVPDEVDWAMVATRAKLIEAFGTFTGMDKSWFDNLTHSPRLMDARKFTGQGGRHSAEPLFCPLLVMQWLADPKRKKGKPLTDTTAWRLLKSHFPKVYNQYSIGDPNTNCPG